MPQAKPKPEKSARGGMGARTGLLAALLAVVAAVAVWLSDCVPGFGIGGGEGEGEGTEKIDETKPPTKAETPSKPAAPEPTITRIEVGIAGCALADETAIPCADLCKRIAADELAGTSKLIIAAKQGSHADVTTLLDCVNAKKLPVAMQRD